MSYSPTPLVGADAQLRQSSILGQVYAWMTLASKGSQQALMSAQLTMAHIRISAALRSLQDTERSLGLSGLWPHRSTRLRDNHIRSKSWYDLLCTREPFAQ